MDRVDKWIDWGDGYKDELVVMSSDSHEWYNCRL